MASTEGPIANIKGSSQAAGDKNPQHVLVVDGSGNPVTFGGSGGTSSTDGGTFTADTTLGTPAMGAYESTPTTLTNGEVGIVGLTANRELKVSVTSGGTAGVQYTQGDTDATITGTALMYEGAADALVVPSTAAPLPVQIGDGTDLATVRDVTGAKALDVSIVDGSGNQVTSFGGGVQYTQGDTDATITGTAMLMEAAADTLVPVQGTVADGVLVNLGANNDVTVTSGNITADTELPAAAALADNASNPTAPAVGSFGMLWDGATWDRAAGNATDGQLVNLGANNDVTVTGSVTANAGTNLNTSALALESGGNLAAATTALQIIDDWDETDRAKVNLIVGQAGVAAGAGAVGATTQRATLASDDPAVVALQLLDDAVITDDAEFTPATTKVHMIGFQADEASTDIVDEGDGGAARMTLDRKVITTPQPHTAGGLSTFRTLDLDETEEDVKTSAGQVYGVWFTNTATSTRWLKFYNDTAANVIVGTTAPVITLGLPGNTSDDISGVFSSTMGIAFSAAICVAATTGVADNDTGAPGANEIIVNVFYR